VHGDRQTTLRTTAGISGIALHTGSRVNLTLHPAPAGSGIRFRRVDLPGRPEVQATIDQVVSTQMATTIADGDAKVHTVEHVLAALSGMGIDNALVEMGGPEPPIVDGSARPFVDLITSAGIREQSAARTYVEVPAPVFIEANDSRLVLLPDACLRICCTVKYGATPLDCQYLSVAITPETFAHELCDARTFCLYEWIEPLIAANLIGGASLDNAVVIKGGAIFSKDGLRYPDELVRHKVLDIVGDLSLLGCRLRGQLIAIKPGHTIDVALVRRLKHGAGR
jgi:UDP-3-O-[3-hydroxymyristoyl] N-acetylglucosamine deacetylase/3-hydroxyacyl-[acyl-carrier-protein] dehydratase